jgi:hypothetical protein
MKNAIGLVIVLALNLGCGAGPAQDSGVKVTQLTDRVYLLSTDQGEYTTNTIAFVGEDGILLVDTQAEDDAEALRLAVDAFGLRSTSSTHIATSSMWAETRSSVRRRSSSLMHSSQRS